MSASSKPCILILALPGVAGYPQYEDLTPCLARLRANGSFFRLRPRAFGQTRAAFLQPMAGSKGSPLGVYQWRYRGNTPKIPWWSRLVEMLPRRRSVLPLRRALLRGWKEIRPTLEPGFVPLASLAHMDGPLSPNQTGDFFESLEENEVPTLACYRDYEWWERTRRLSEPLYDWIYHDDYMNWLGGALKGKEAVCYVEIGRRLERHALRRGKDSPGISGALRKLDREVDRLVKTFTSAHRRPLVLIVSFESPAGVEAEFNLEAVLESRFLLPGREYAAAIHPTFAQIWHIEEKSSDYVSSAVEGIGQIRILPAESIHPGGPASRDYGDLILAPDHGTILRPNHIDGWGRRRAAAGWSEHREGDLGSALFVGEEWAEGPEPGTDTTVEVLRSMILDTLGLDSSAGNDRAEFQQKEEEPGQNQDRTSERNRKERQ